VEGSGRGLILGNIQEFVSGTSDTLPDTSVEISWTEDPLHKRSWSSYRLPARSRKFILDWNLVA